MLAKVYSYGIIGLDSYPVCIEVDVANGIVKVRLVGSCHGCPSSMMTLKAGIERAIRAEVPEIVSVEAVDA